MGIRSINNNQGGSIRVLTTSPGVSGGGVWCGQYLLNQHPGAIGAYSLRKLRQQYKGPAIRVRRSSDNAETDIGFVFGLEGVVLDETTLTTFVGAGNGFITTWYDQSGNNLHQVRTIANQQPQIVTSGTVYKDNGRPALYFDGNMSMRSVINVSLTSVLGEWSSFGVARVLDFSTARVLFSYQGVGAFGDIPAIPIGQFLRSSPTPTQTFQAVAFNTVGGFFNEPGPSYNSNQNILNSIRTTTTIEMFANGITNGPTSTTGIPRTGITPLDIGYRNGINFSPAFQPLGYIQELIHYPLDSTNFYQKAVRDINSFYKVY